MFLLLKGDLDNRLDPLFYSEDIFKFLKITSFAIKKIREICTFAKSGFGAGKQDQNLEGKGVIQIRPTNMDENGLLKFDRNVYIPENYLETNNAYVLSKEDVLFNNTNSQEWVGKTAYFKEEGTFLHSNHVTVLQVDKNIIQPKYLWILLNIYQQKKIFYNICTNWNNQSGVGIDRLLSLKIPVPSLETQQIIINIFEKAYALKKEKEAQAKDLLASIDDYLLKSLGIVFPEKVKANSIFFTHFKNVQGDRFDPFYHKVEFDILETSIKNGLYPIQKMGVFLSQINYGASVKSDYVEFGIPFLRISDLERNEIDLSEMKYLPESMKKDIGNAIVYENDFLISRSGTIGVVARVGKEFNGFAYGSFMIKFCLKDDALIEKDYLSFFLNCGLMQKIIIRNKIGAIQGNITIPTIKNFEIPLPPLSIQNEIAEHIRGIRATAKALENEAKEILEQAKAEVERMILGE